jgi:hypothetical protein
MGMLSRKEIVQKIDLNLKHRGIKINISITENYIIFADYIPYLEDSCQSGLTNHVWQDIRAAIAPTVGVLGYQYHPDI